MLVIGVGDDLHTANGNVSHMGHHFDRVGILSSADKNDQPTESDGDAGDSQIFRELAARNLMIVWI
jgi:hypothetical protein